MDDILKFYGLINRLKKVDRQHFVVDSYIQERTPEHSYSTAMLAWYICETENLPLDTGLVLKYALAHDLVEAYAGDVSRFEKDIKKKKLKKQMEQIALDKIEKDFSNFSELTDLIKKYEGRGDPEANFVYAVDALESEVNAYLDNHKVWLKLGITKTDVIEKTKKKFSAHPVIEKYFLELMEKID